jgi:hypothetical protein
MRSQPSKSIGVSILIVAGSAFSATPAFAADAAASDALQAHDYTVTLTLVLAGVIALVVVAIVFSAFQNRGESARKRREAELMHQASQAGARFSAPQAAMPEAVPAEATGETNQIDVNERTPMVTLPAKLPESFEERDLLIKQMVAAEPDRANPFISPKARLRRARLILQSIGHTFKEGEAWIDLSDYPHIWPELAREKAAAGPRSKPASDKSTDKILEPA